MRRLATAARPFVLLGAALALAAGSGLLAATALGTSTQEPTQTITIDATGTTGPTGPAGPQGEPGPPGPPGPAGSFDCPTAYVLSDVVFIQQGKGPTTILACVRK